LWRISTFEAEMSYYFLQIVFSLLGLFLHPFFYSFHILELCTRSKQIKRVLHAVYNPRRLILGTFVLYMMLSYQWAVWGFHRFREEYLRLGPEYVYQYWMWLFDKLWKYSGAIGGYLESTDAYKASFRFTFERYAYDGFYNVFCRIMIFQILNGIIIDTFKKLRRFSQKKTKDILNKCFICGRYRYEFDKL